MLLWNEECKTYMYIQCTCTFIASNCGIVIQFVIKSLFTMSPGLFILSPGLFTADFIWLGQGLTEPIKTLN